MSERAPYSRVYWSVIDDPKFEGVYDDDAAFALWMRLLMNADALWPAPAALPRSTKAKPLGKLVDAGIIDLLPRDRYRIHGLDAERGRRRDAARTPPKREPDGNRLPPKREVFGPPARAIDETRQDKSSQRAGDDGRADLEMFLLLKRRAPTERQRKLLDDVLDRRDQTGPEWAADVMVRHPDDPIGAVIEADKAWRAERIAEAQAAERPNPKPRRPKGMPTSTRDLINDWAASANVSELLADGKGAP